MVWAMSSKFAYSMLLMSVVKSLQAEPIKQILINLFLAGLMLKKANTFFFFWTYISYNKIYKHKD